MLIVTFYLLIFVSDLWRFSYAQDLSLFDSSSSADLFAENDSGQQQPNLFSDTSTAGQNLLSAGTDLNSISYLADNSAAIGGSDDNLFTDSSLNDSNDIALTTGDMEGLELIGDNGCPTSFNGKSRRRKRDGASCPNPGTVPLLTLPTLPFLNDGMEPNGQDNNDDEQLPGQTPEEKPKKNKLYGGYYDENPAPFEPKTDNYDLNKCPGLYYIIARLVDVCCDGGFGPFVIDKKVRLIYDWIDKCEMGKYTSGRYPDK